MKSQLLRFKRPFKWLTLSILVVGIFTKLPYFQADASVPATFPCSWGSGVRHTFARTLPKTHYLYSQRYGWFDTTHFNTGKPGKVLADVREAVQRGGGVITIKQLVGSKITGYVAHYTVAQGVTKEQIFPVALGIYLDWSIRFEAWQARLPHSVAGPFTSYALEDLPSQYIGFYAHSHHIPVEQVFACYLGEVEGTEEGPPHFDILPETDGSDLLPNVVRLQNKTFNPFVETEQGWQSVKWPKDMELQTIGSSPETWQFMGEKTWYWDYRTYRKSNP